MQGGYSVRAATAAEVALLPEIERAAAELFTEFGLAELFARLVTPASVFEAARESGSLWVAAAPGGDVVGFASACVVGGNAHLDELDVLPSWGRQGIGTALVETFLSWARTSDFPAATLTTLQHVPWNAPFYERLGFAIVPQTELTTALADLLREEVERGLPAENRVAMCLRLRALGAERVKTSRYLVRGLTFDAVGDGPADGELVILLHGLPRTHWEWHHQMPVLAGAGYRVVAPNLRGYSAGACPDGVSSYHTREMVADVLALADALDPASRPFHLVGTSTGAAVAWQLAADHPERLLTLSCFNLPHPQALRDAMGVDADDQVGRFDYVGFMRKEGSERQLLAEDAKLLRALLQRMGPGLPEAEIAPYLEAFGTEDRLRPVLNWYRAGFDDVVNSSERVPNVSVPTLYVWPTEGANVAPETAKRNSEYVDAGYTFRVLDGAANLVAQGAPDLVNELLLAHLGSRGDTPPGGHSPQALVQR